MRWRNDFSLQYGSILPFSVAEPQSFTFYVATCLSGGNVASHHGAECVCRPYSNLRSLRSNFLLFCLYESRELDARVECLYTVSSALLVNTLVSCAVVKKLPVVALETSKR